MSKILNLLRILLLFLVCYAYLVTIQNKINFPGVGLVICLILLLLLLIFTTIDLFKSNSINKNNTYHIISILTFSIMTYILYRASNDSTLFFNMPANEYMTSFYEYRTDFVTQNLIYFDIMLLALLTYRLINNKKISN